MKKTTSRLKNKELPPVKVYGRQDFLVAIRETAKKEGISQSKLCGELIAKGIKYKGRI